MDMQNVKEKLRKASAAPGRGLVYTGLTCMYRPKLHYKNHGVEEALQQGGNIIVGNHVGHHDGQMFYTLFPKSALLIAKDWADKRIVNWIINGAHFIPVDREGMDISWIADARAEIEAGRNVIIFPEGHTSKGEMDEFKPGFAMLSVLTGAKIIPVYHEDEYNRFVGKRLNLYVGEPVELTVEGKGLNADYLKQESQRIQEIVKDMRDKYCTK